MQISERMAPILARYTGEIPANFEERMDRISAMDQPEFQRRVRSIGYLTAHIESPLTRVLSALQSRSYEEGITFISNHQKRVAERIIQVLKSTGRTERSSLIISSYGGNDLWSRFGIADENGTYSAGFTLMIDSDGVPLAGFGPSTMAFTTSKPFPNWTEEEERDAYLNDIDNSLDHSYSPAILTNALRQSQSSPLPTGFVQPIFSKTPDGLPNVVMNLDHMMAELETYNLKKLAQAVPSAITYYTDPADIYATIMLSHAINHTPDAARLTIM